jgi:hypothetical protein
MDTPDPQEALTEPRPRVLTVVALVLGAAAVVSYLVAYAMTGALVSAEVIQPFAPGNDPRPRWLATTFVLLCAILAAVALVLRWLSVRQLHEIDRMNESE